MISQKGINPTDVVEAYQSNDSVAMEALYDKAQKLIELQKIYRELCLQYCNKLKGEGEVR